MHRLFILLSLFIALGAQAQDPWLDRLEQMVAARRDNAADRGSWDTMVQALTSPTNPLTVLLDNLKIDDPQAETHGSKADPMRVNGVVTRAYGARRGVATSKGDFYNSLERGVKYSLIEKTVAPGRKAVYTLTGHLGAQEFVLIPYGGADSSVRFTVAVDGKPVELNLLRSRIARCAIPALRPGQTVTITADNSSSAQPAPFVVINHNARK